MLRPVELDTAGNPRASKSHKRGFDDVIVVDEVTLFDFVISHLHTSTKLGQYHHLDVFILQPDGLPVLIHLLV